jgi:NADH-quinone oxidoreductase subunit J
VGALGVALSIGVIFSSHPVRSLFCLIGVFLSAIFMLLSIRVEFLSMIFLIVYIGAIAILFLFVIMLLNLKQATPVTSRRHQLANLKTPLLFLILSERSYVFLSSAVYLNSYYNSRKLAAGPTSSLFELNQMNYYLRYGLSDAAIFSDLLYSTHGFLFLTTACILAVAMIGAIVLALSASKAKV